ncbi:hypothetical protein MRS76_19565 [Rhizobiaceae bacterium n13]|uniref:Cytochrome c domain-containing protein n=1 Tax=Ferirhizobium litorale TaxID=2927786 RepID=A0AAE3U576_9HYPH|nr:hypothetical protein [Fererhizobium litorale]MDI7864148.1 hypothetical protein [Fererhizobium litorale]MDI7923759.1 hypothetical protein [Fererhizobium litorale]
MNARIFLLSLFLVAGCEQAFADCPSPANDEFDTVATALFNCSSARPLQGHETDRKFQIHYDFPQTLPDASTLPWMSIDPMANPAGYLQAILNYATRINARDDVDWRIEDNEQESWCSAPWFHMLREPLHGMTSERWSRPKELHELQGDWARNWAVGIYNDVACYGFGQIWKDPTFPKTKGFAFADGALAIKMLFTNAMPSQVPYLTGSKEWTVAANDDGSTITMRLLQLDVSTKDKRSPNGWFFGTFMYDATQPGDTVWERLVPVGLIWGNDNDLTAGAYLEKAAVAKESWVNPAVADRFYALPRHNLGLFGRANGPVDNPRSACISCHQRALDWGRAVLRGSPEEKEARLLLPDVPNDPFNDAAVKAYFRDIGNQSPVPNTQSMDYSLQVSEGIEAFRTWVATAFPDHATSTTDVTPYPFTSAAPIPTAPVTEAAPIEVPADKFEAGTIDIKSDLFVR